MFSMQMSRVNIHVHAYRQTKIKKNKYSYAPELKFEILFTSQDK